jgi:hypothetical protein
MSVELINPMSPHVAIDLVTYRRVYPNGHNIDEAIYEVLLGGKVVGQVWKGWSRLGGQGWQTRHGGGSSRTRHTAVKNALHRILRENIGWNDFATHRSTS